MYPSVQRHSQRGRDNELPDCVQRIGQSKQTSHKTAEEFVQVVLDVVDVWYVRSVQTVAYSVANFEVDVAEQV